MNTHDKTCLKKVKIIGYLRTFYEEEDAVAKCLNELFKLFK